MEPPVQMTEGHRIDPPVQMIAIDSKQLRFTFFNFFVGPLIEPLIAPVFDFACPSS